MTDDGLTIGELAEAAGVSRIEELEASLRIVGARIDLYDGRLTDRSVIWRLVDEARRRTDG